MDQGPGIVAAPRRAAVAFIFITLVIDVLGFGLVIPVLPKLVEQFMGGDTHRAAEVYGLFGASWSAMQFVFSPLLGALSDRWGRRRVLLISCFGLGVDYIVMALAPTVGWLLCGRIFSGICASSFATAGAYISDVTPPEKRAQAFGMMGAAFGLGFVVGPALGGVLGHLGPRLPFWASAALALLNFGYGLFVLPESLPPERRDAFRWQKANPVGALRLLRAHTGLLGLAGVNLLFQVAHHVLPSMYVLYTGYRYGWNTLTVGLTLMTTGLFSIVVQGAMVKPAVRWLGERGALLAGLGFGIAGFTWFALAPNQWWMWAGLPVFAWMGLFGPGLQSLMSRRVPPQEQGKLQGANSSIVGIAGLVGPLLFTQIFAFAIDKTHAWSFPGAPFFVAAGLLGLSLALALLVTQGRTAAPVQAG
ncbi:MAG: TCR/Tet family MFS transporter [Nevskia sp.]|nr:TCR/Tet family MFS transporter [Nevskia sp.]